MNYDDKAVCTILLTFIFSGIAAPAQAGMWDDPQNIKALSKDITPEELRATMRGFAGATGSRCSSCHVGEDENDLRTYDFSLDDKEKKQKAREMILMVKDINSRLADVFDKSPEELVTVDCATCHHGQAKPEKIQVLLARSYYKGGLEEATAEYHALRERYYGDYTFDFSEKALMIIAEQMAADDEVSAALGFLDLNLQFYPQSDRSFVLQGQILAANGNIPQARSSYLKALEIRPDSPWTQQLLSALDEN